MLMTLMRFITAFPIPPALIGFENALTTARGNSPMTPHGEYAKSTPPQRPRDLVLYDIIIMVIISQHGTHWWNTLVSSAKLLMYARTGAHTSMPFQDSHATKVWTMLGSASRPAKQI